MRITIDPGAVATNFAQFQNNASLQESAQLFAKGLPIAEMIQALAMNRGVLSAFAAFEAIYPHGQLERPLLEKVILAISTRNRCQFCVGSHVAITKGLGISSAEVTDPLAAEHSARERLALQYALALHHDSNRIPEPLFDSLRQTFSNSEIVELTFLTGFINMLNWFNNALEVRYQDEFQSLKIS